MKKYRLHFLILIVVLLLLLWKFCGHCKNDNGKAVAEGVIEYSAVAIDQANPMANMAPSKMTVRFKNNKSIAEMSAGMGTLSPLAPVGGVCASSPATGTAAAVPLSPCTLR